MASVVLVASVSALTVLLINGPSGPESRYGNPALDAIVALPEQLYSPPSPLESSRDAAKRVEPLVTHDLFVAMSAPRERETDYRMAVVAQQRGTVTARAYIDDLGVRNGDDSPTSVSRTVIVVQKMSFPGGRAWEDRFGVIVDVTPVDGTWKANSFAPAPLLDVMAMTPPPPPPGAPPPPPPPPVSRLRRRRRRRPRPRPRRRPPRHLRLARRFRRRPAGPGQRREMGLASLRSRSSRPLRPSVVAKRTRRKCSCWHGPPWRRQSAAQRLRLFVLSAASDDYSAGHSRHHHGHCDTHTARMRPQRLASKPPQ